MVFINQTDIYDHTENTIKPFMASCVSKPQFELRLTSSHGECGVAGLMPVKLTLS